MEVGAVKQAFNNEVILLKRKLNQAKTQVIHKLTRKAKTLTQKKAPDHLKEKLKRKAESAVNEVLIMKKIKARDIAKFIITHKGLASDYINRPQVDIDKACARLVLHKSMQEKYKFIRNRFGNIPIADLFMSRQERRKLKMEAKEQQKNKKKSKDGKVTNSAGDWDVEDVKVGDGGDISDDEISGNKNEHLEEEKSVWLGKENYSEEADSVNGDQNSSDHDNSVNGDENDSDQDEMVSSNENTSNQDDSENGDENASDQADSDGDGNVSNLSTGNEKSDDKSMKSEDSDDEIVTNSNNDGSEDEEVGKLIKLKPKNKVKPVDKPKPINSSIDTIETNFYDFMAQKKQTKTNDNKVDKKIKENKNKNFKEKLQNRKFKKHDADARIEGKKVVDPFFRTATGESYLTLAEPRQPDEVKEVHKQGNRQERRAVMFGRKFKPRNDFRNNNHRTNTFNEGYDSRNSDGRNKNYRFDNSENVNDRNSKFNDRNGKFNERNSKYNGKNERFNSTNVSNNRNDDKKEEKLHPSWEAKRKLKSISLLPSQGKKIVFNDN